MAGINPADIVLPAFLDPVMSYLADALPSSFYSLLLGLLSHSLALFTALFNLVTSLLSTSPFQWDAQTILPPLISFLASYVAIVGLYRTTSWMVRTSVWFVKWGTILGALFAGVGWYMGTTYAGAVGSSSIVSNIGSLVYDVINRQGQDAASSTRYRSQAQRTRTRSDKKKPKSWDSFERHQGWQHQEHETGVGGNGNAEKVFQDIAGKVGQVVKDSGWWNMAKRIVDGASDEDNHSESAGDASGNKRRGHSRSR